MAYRRHTWSWLLVAAAALLVASLGSGAAVSATNDYRAFSGTSTVLKSSASARGTTRLLNADAPDKRRPDLEAVVADGRSRGLTPEEALSSWLTEHSAPSGLQDGDTPILDDLSDAELTDLLTYASDRDTPILDVIARHGSEQEFNLVVDQLGRVFPDEYLGSIVPQDGRAALHVIFRGTAPPESLERLKSLNQRVLVEEFAGLSTGDLRSLPDAGADLLTTRGIPCTIYFDLERRQWIVTCEPGQGTLEDISSAVSYLADTAAVAIDTNRAQVVPSDQGLRGGAMLNGTGNCTSGFVVVKTDGTKRLATAGHCAKGNAAYTYLNWVIDGGSTTVDRKTYNYGPDDWGLYGPGGFNPRPVFYYQTDAKRTVTGQQDSPPAMYSNTCHFGRATKNSCGDFLSAFVDVTYSDGTHLNDVSMAYHLSADGGDSGGPVFSGSIAYGIHSGADASEPVNDRTIYFDPLWKLSPTVALRGWWGYVESRGLVRI